MKWTVSCLSPNWIGDLSMKQATLDATTEAASQRRSQRMLLVITVTVSWRTSAGVTLRQHAATEVVNAHGALLKIKATIPVNSIVDLIRPSLNRSAKGRVVCCGTPSEDGLSRVAVEFLERNDEFWGISFPPAERKAIWHTA